MGSEKKMKRNDFSKIFEKFFTKVRLFAILSAYKAAEKNREMITEYCGFDLHEHYGTEEKSIIYVKMEIGYGREVVRAGCKDGYGYIPRKIRCTKNRKRLKLKPKQLRNRYYPFTPLCRD